MQNSRHESGNGPEVDAADCMRYIFDNTVNISDIYKTIAPVKHYEVINDRWEMEKYFISSLAIARCGAYRLFLYGRATGTVASLGLASDQSL